MIRLFGEWVWRSEMLLAGWEMDGHTGHLDEEVLSRKNQRPARRPA